MWRLSTAWYGDRLDPDYTPKSSEVLQSLFDVVGLRGPFWRLPG